MENSKIAWTDHTWNGHIGCTRVSPGCENCYAEELMDRRYGKVEWGPGNKRMRTSEKYWRKPYKWNKESDPDNPTKVFCYSLADWLDHEVPFDWILEHYNIILETPNLRWLMLTKRADRIADMLLMLKKASGKAPPFNMVFMFSAENQEWFDKRWPRFKFLAEAGYNIGVSAEPLLGPITIPDDFLDLGKRAWWIDGGESGVRARPMHPDWPAYHRDQCLDNHVPYFFKQWGRYRPAIGGESADVIFQSCAMKINEDKHFNRLENEYHVDYPTWLRSDADLV